MRLKTKEDRLEMRQYYINSYKANVKEYTEIDCLIATYEEKDKYCLMIFQGSAGKPREHIVFRSNERREKHINEYIESQQKWITYKKEQKEKNKGVLTGAAATAKAIKGRLKKEFPNIKFSVCSDNFSMGNSVNISWTDGPVSSLVERITDQYQYGRFDGMTDYSYSVSIDEKALGCSGAKYIRCNRTQSEERKAELEKHCLEKTGKTIKDFLSHFNGGVWYYENNNPDTWPEEYQKMLSNNKQEDEKTFQEEQQEKLQTIEEKEPEEEFDNGEPATKRQLFALHCICRTNTTGWKLTKLHASKLISSANNGGTVNQILEFIKGVKEGWNSSFHS
jgi:hypothetical protein